MVADVVPLIGNVLGAGAGIVSFLLTLILAPVVIAIAWFWYRPLISLAVLVVTAAGIIGWAQLAKRQRAVAPLRQAYAPTCRRWQDY